MRIFLKTQKVNNYRRLQLRLVFDRLQYASGYCKSFLRLAER
ncbi:hypothetical protein RPMD05_43 [Rhodobacteraceae phage LS06-2018-MD05]|nr:hypothetical protein RPMD05_43 [Rhodobacteraceae phage LS06-2018-MD05]